ncbi:FAD-binding oxidoreductase [Cupriavidus sp. L7L]|uniref:FAD-binding oxidoreductase n=1 Tax=Cupriavidus sp. L7L TaxID=2546443 RepID=UPI001056D278|nr:FAD-linked oxidase C-terminal domain-containing protein [Cupriavidus sp. L7L]TDF63189.1 FAD-binding protein [Cupriavidus sp. L7L]
MAGEALNETQTAHAEHNLGEGSLVAQLENLLGNRFTRSGSVASQYLATEGHLSTAVPWGIAKPSSVDEVQAIHRICNQHAVPLIPFGSGSSVEGQVAATSRSLILDMRELNAVIDVDHESMTARVQAGVTRLQLEGALRDSGLFFPVDPGADATLGGMAATRASGTNAVRYGTMRENTLALDVVLADGTLLACGARTAKAANGYDLMHLFVGAEGTLGTITELTVRLYPRPEEVAGGIFCFPDVASAISAVTEFRQAAIPVARVELLDATTVRALNTYSGLTLPDSPMLLVELHGSAAAVAEQCEMVRALAADNGCTEPMYADDRAQREKLWTACHKRYYACRALRPAARAIATDVCVPISRLAETVEATLKDIEGVSIPITLHGHVGDGNFHTVVLLDETSPSELKEFNDYSKRLALRAIENGGTCSGEHGIGLGKQRYLRAEHGEALDWMRNLKSMFDPRGIMNPGKNIDIQDTASQND